VVIAALLLQLAYRDLPEPSRERVIACRTAYNDLQGLVGDFKALTYRMDVDRGGRMTWNQASDQRNLADNIARPYLEAIRRIAFRGEVEQCRAIARAGQIAVRDQVMKPLAGR
jgi:hypothetical protein